MSQRESNPPSTWFVTGASRGFGRELTEQVLARGGRVAATLRRPAQLDDLAAQYRDRLWVRALDVTDTGQMRRVVREAFADLGRIDVVVSNAGYGVFGAAEDLTDAQVEAVISTNLTASIQLARAVLPYLRAQGGGLLMQMSSMGGHIAFPAFSMYHATKWGIEGFYEALAARGRAVRDPHDAGRARDDPHQLLPGGHAGPGQPGVPGDPGGPGPAPARADAG